jgi:hypothetical protein
MGSNRRVAVGSEGLFYSAPQSAETYNNYLQGAMFAIRSIHSLQLMHHRDQKDQKNRRENYLIKNNM